MWGILILEVKYGDTSSAKSIPSIWNEKLQIQKKVLARLDFGSRFRFYLHTVHHSGRCRVFDQTA